MTNKAPIAELIAAEANLGGGVTCFTTHRDFDGDIKSPWRETTMKLAELLASRGQQARAIVSAGQIHSSEVAVVDALPSEAAYRVSNVDGLVTNQRGVALVIRTADCVPVVVVDVEAGIAGAFHSGWRGTLAGIVTRGVGAMVALGAEANRLRAWAGPAIAAPAYEVSEELIAQFRAVHGDNAERCIRGRNLDLCMLNSLQLHDAGLAASAIEVAAMCTFADSKRFHSHRRQGTARGHLYTVVGLHL